MSQLKSRTKMSGINFTASIVARIVTMLTSFVGRSIFVKTLSAEYLGLGGFFGNIFAIVSLCELGLGGAISQSLYKPLSQRDEYKIAAIVDYFTKVYRYVAAVSLILSLAALPVLPKITKTDVGISTVLAAYLLFCIHSFLSYLLAPKIHLVVCDQRMYVPTITRTIFNVVGLIFQCFALVYTGNYLLYLGIRIIILFVSDVVINMYADRKYPYVFCHARVDEKYKRNIMKKTKALMWHKIGGVFSRSTDSLLLTYFVGLSGMGKYSNYALFIGTVGAFFDAAVNACSASVGNLGAEDRSDKAESVMKKMYFINFYVLTVGTSVILCTLTPFIELWLGKEMLFGEIEMIIIVMSFYFSCIRDPVQIFVTTFGLFAESRFIPMLRAAANLVFSTVFVKGMGVGGVFLGTILSTILVPLPMEVYVLYRHGLNKKCTPFVKEMCKYICMSFFVFGVCYALTLHIGSNLSELVLRGTLALAVSLSILHFVYEKSDCYSEIKRLVVNMLEKKP